MHNEILSRLCYLGDKTERIEESKSDNEVGGSMRKEILPKEKKEKSVVHVGIERWLNYQELKEVMLVIKAVNHRLRKALISLLEKNEVMTVTDIYQHMKLEQSVASQHLGILRRAGVVMTSKNGKYIYYSLNRDRIYLISNMISSLNANK